MPIQILTEWIDHLKTELLFSLDDPLFLKTKVANTKDEKIQGLRSIKGQWKTAHPIRAIFKRSFENAGLQYFKPHSLRDTLVRLAEQLCQSPEEFKAWSQNLAHESVLTTFYSYGDVPDNRQEELIKRLINSKRCEAHNELEATLKKVLTKILST